MTGDRNPDLFLADVTDAKTGRLIKAKP